VEDHDAVSTRGRLKTAVLPKGRTIRTLPLGIAKGIRMEIDFAHQTQLYLGLYEHELNKHLRRLAVPGAPAFDVGGADGYDALVIARLTGARVVTVERSDAAMERLRRNLAANPWADVDAVHTSVAATSDGAIDRHTLDELAYGRGDAVVPGFVKIDVEGAELAALQGANRLLGEAHPSLLVEVHAPWLEEQCIELVRSHGYHAPVIVDRRRFLKEHRPMAHNRWLVWSRSR
jgi:hypothetical protein